MDLKNKNKVYRVVKSQNTFIGKYLKLITNNIPDYLKIKWLINVYIKDKLSIYVRGFHKYDAILKQSFLFL